MPIHLRLHAQRTDTEQYRYRSEYELRRVDYELSRVMSHKGEAVSEIADDRVRIVLNGFGNESIFGWIFEPAKRENGEIVTTDGSETVLEKKQPRLNMMHFMKKIKSTGGKMKFLNIIYYFIWRFGLITGKATRKFTNFILKPFKWLLLKIPFVRNRYIKLYGSMENAEKTMRNAYDYVMYNPEWSFTMYFACAFYGGTIIFYIWGLYFLLAHYLPLPSIIEKREYMIESAFVFLAIAGVITYFASYKNDRFKVYFKKFDQIKGWKRFLYKLMVFIVVCGSLVFWFWAILFTYHK